MKFFTPHSAPVPSLRSLVQPPWPRSVMSSVSQYLCKVRAQSKVALMDADPIYKHKDCNLCNGDYFCPDQFRIHHHCPAVKVCTSKCVSCIDSFLLWHSHAVSLWLQFYSNNTDELQLKQESLVWWTLNKKQSRSHKSWQTRALLLSHKKGGQKFYSSKPFSTTN